MLVALNTGMKTLIFGMAIAVAVVSHSEAESQEDLMRRMGFSEQQIQATQTNHESLHDQLAATGPKTDPAVAQRALKEADMVNRVRGLNYEQYKAEQTAQIAEENAGKMREAATKAKEKVKEADAEWERIFHNVGSGNLLDNALAVQRQAEDEASEADRLAREAGEKAAGLRKKADSVKRDSVAEQKLIEERMRKEAGLEH